ncbi:MAG: prepilin-type N-terminal cleavage/methylation domain-containing protein [Kiritimatiellae bacterium]|nr:prepilin-type N-terminal cleavage/methylation domain-containing protein [Kiritimatiellia bacterium]
MKNDSSGFTLIEILTVIAVIGIVAGMMFPIYGRVKNSAQNAAGTDLCAQVAAAWNTLLIENRRFPSEALIRKCAGNEKNNGGFKSVGGDVVFRMSPAAGSLLNWWARKAPVPAKDEALFAPTYAVSGGGVKKGAELSISAMNGDDGEKVQYWPPDTRFERDFAQKRAGVFAPWIHVPKDEALSSTNLFETVSVSDIVYVSLDLDGDGSVPVNVALSGDDADAGDDDVEKIPASSAAWIYRKDGNRSKLIKSW